MASCCPSHNAQRNPTCISPCHYMRQDSAHPTPRVALPACQLCHTSYGLCQAGTQTESKHDWPAKVNGRHSLATA
jgi:hypothetical protein